MDYIIGFFINIVAMGKPDKRDIKWFPILILSILLLVGFSMFYNTKW